MNRSRCGRGVALVVALALVALATTLLVVVALSVKHLTQRDLIESDQALLRQMIDSGAVWARAHQDDWPAVDGRPRSVQLNADSLVPASRRGTLTLIPVLGSDGRTIKARLEATVVRSRGQTAYQTATVSLPSP
ncbi:MAG: hypothetical protein JSV19_09880 [Phycisphaerales bacterium]|nr:MAG: hypothetical protein JSV19_09880 [Phycisphaerales bacterium]